MIDSLAGSAGAAPLADSQSDTTQTRNSTNSAVNKETFLQLLVAQIKNQNPLNPADGVQFLTQLAQFSELEQMMAIRTEVAGMREQMQQAKQEETGSGSSQDQNTSGAGNV